MAEVCPFRGIRYNEEIVGDLAQVICPPYDIITPQQQKQYHEKSRYNAIHLEHPLPATLSETKGGQSNHNKYSRAATTFQQWLKEGILQVDRVSSFYLHDHHFEHSGEKRARRGLIARVKLKPWGSGIYPHEETFSKAKDDRLQLMRACQANFSPLFALYQDSEGKIAKILSEASQGKAMVELANSSESHAVWAIAQPKLVHRISELLVTQSLYIADGHHRYETALTYQQERARYHPDFEYNEEEESHRAQDKLREESPREAFNYVMMTLVDFSDPGLVVFPVYRLVCGIAPSILADLENRLRDLFTLEYIPLTKALPCHSERSEEPQRPFVTTQGMVSAILGLKPQSLVVLRQRQDVSIEDMMPKDRSWAYRNFDVSLLNHLILGRMLGLPQDSESITYTVDLDEVCQQIKEGKYQLAFLSSPPQPEMVKAVADAKDRMPRKSTYFYPKLPAGLIINSLE